MQRVWLWVKPLIRAQILSVGHNRRWSILHHRSRNYTLTTLTVQLFLHLTLNPLLCTSSYKVRNKRKLMITIIIISLMWWFHASHLLVIGDHYTYLLHRSPVTVLNFYLDIIWWRLYTDRAFSLFSPIVLHGHFLIYDIPALKQYMFSL